MAGTVEIKVEGMGCQACVSAVQKAVSGIDQAATTRVDLASGLVRVEGTDASKDAIAAAISAAGYDIAA